MKETPESHFVDLEFLEEKDVEFVIIENYISEEEILLLPISKAEEERDIEKKISEFRKSLEFNNVNTLSSSPSYELDLMLKNYEIGIRINNELSRMKRSEVIEVVSLDKFQYIDNK